MNPSPATLRPVHALLAVQSLVVVLISANRLSDLTLGYVAPNQFLRWVDLVNMLPLPLLSLAAFYLLKKRLEYDSPAREGHRHRLLNLLFVLGIYMLGAGYGAHEVTNYLHTRFCVGPDAMSDLCRIVIFNDDQFSHWVFFAGFVLVNVALLLIQDLFPAARPPARTDSLLLVVNGVFIGLGVFANLAFEEIGFDLAIVALLALTSAILLWRQGRQPLTIYYLTAYSLGLIGTLLYKIFAT